MLIAFNKEIPGFEFYFDDNQKKISKPGTALLTYDILIKNLLIKKIK